MYATFFGLKQEPFSIAPDPRYLFMSERHREALAHLLYGVRGGGGFVLLTGEIGAGKTTVCRCLLEQIPKRCNVAYIFNPKLTVPELLKTICEEFRIPRAPLGRGATVKDYLDPLNQFLLNTHALGQNNLLIIDEAQNLSADVLEQLRLLTNLETSERKLLQIVLIGQPELRQMLARPELEQLAQRVIARYHLDALSEEETAQYIRHRLAVAGLHTAPPFDDEALKRIHRLARGVPRRINLLCDRALLGAYATGRPRVDKEIVDKAAGEVFTFTPPRPREGPKRSKAPSRAAAISMGVAAGAAMAGVLGGLAVWALGLNAPRGAAPAVAAPRAAASAASAPRIASAASAASEAARSASAVPAAAQPVTALREQLLRDEQQAWRELASAWKLPPADGDPCAAAERAQVQCFKGPLTLALVRQLGRPGILTLYDDASVPLYAVLTGLSDQAATLQVAGRPQQVSLVSIARWWRGDFATYWRAPPGYKPTAAGAGVGPLAPWLAQQLATLSGDPPGGADADLRAQVSAFQVSQGLKPDGLAGPATLMQLNRATGVDEPRLKSER